MNASALKVRPLIADDLEQVADLFRLRFPGGASRVAVAENLKAIFLDYPARVGDADSLVAIDAQGALAAFSGGFRTPFLFEGRPANVCSTGALMASPASGHAFAAVQVLRESRKLGHDLVVTDTANRASLEIVQATGFRALSPESLEWAAVFAPAGLVVHKIRQRLQRDWIGAARPLARLADAIAAKALRAVEGPPTPSTWRDEEIDDAAFLDLAPRFLESFALRPEFAAPELQWRIAQARRRIGAGPFSLRAIYDPAGTPAGVYAAFGAKGDVARIVHAVAAPHAWGRLFDRMRATARERGCIAAHGVLRPQMIPHAYSARGVFFYYAGGTLYYSPRPEIRDAVESGRSFVGGLAGDRWSPLASG